ncbi:MAG: sugar ABC transporter substrate-binding protein [Bacilli bacterium]|nr:sugar ABC transporter substrate-binding protein [Bacilli bacterium]
MLLLRPKQIVPAVLFVGLVIGSFTYDIAHSFRKPPEDPTGETIHLSLYHWDNGGNTETDLVKEVCKEFEKDNPNITVDVEIISSYETQFQNFMASKNVPDVFLVPDGNFGSWVKTGVMLDLQEYWDNTTNIDKEHLAPSALKRYRWNGSTMGSGDLYCVPKDITPYVMYYNKELFDEYGVPYPSPTEIMDPYEAMELWKMFGYNRNTVRFKTNGEMRLMDDHIYGVAKLYPEGLIWSNGADYLNEARNEALIDSDEFIEAYEYIVEATMEYAVAPTSKVITSTPEKSLFLNGKAACYIEGRSVTTDLRNKASFDWDIAPIPAFPALQQVNGWSGSVGYAVYKDCEHKDEAYHLAEYFTSKRGQIIMAEAGFTAPLYNDEQTMQEFYAIEEGKLPANTGEFIRAAQYQRPGLWQYLPSTRWKTTFDMDTGAMFTEDPSARLTPRQFLTDEKERIEAIIKQDFPELFT